MCESTSQPPLKRFRLLAQDMSDGSSRNILLLPRSLWQTLWCGHWTDCLFCWQDL